MADGNHPAPTVLKRVLIVEDTVDIAVWLATALESDDLDIRIKVTGFADLLKPEAWVGVNVAVLDAMLPDVSGLEIARWARDNRPDVRLVLATASIPAAEEATGLVDHVLLKPFTTEQLMEAIHA